MARAIVCIYLASYVCLAQAGQGGEALCILIRRAVSDLGYTAVVSEQLIKVLNGWQDSCGVDLTRYQERLAGPRSSSTELTIASSLLRLTTDRLTPDDQTFELPEVLATGKANCLGAVQLFYVLARSIGLSVIPIEVLQLQSPGPLPIGSAHISCMIRLSDGRMVMLNKMPRYGISRSFDLEELFKKDSLHWHLMAHDNPLKLYKTIRPLDLPGLVAFIYNNRGTSLANAGLYDRAADWYLKALVLDPENANVYNNLGIVYRNKGLFDEAIDSYDKAIALHNQYAEAFNNRAVAYNLLGRPAQAILDCNQAIAICPYFAQAYNNRANAYLRLGQYVQALSDYSMTIKLDPKIAQAYVNRAIVYTILGRHASARQDLARALRLDPGLEVKVNAITKRFALDQAR